MATYTAFLDILPDPNNPIGPGGQSLSTGSGVTNGPGFASIQFSSKSPTQVSRTNSGRVITRNVLAHNWDIKVTYNPMTRDDFEPVYSFLISKGLNERLTFSSTIPSTLLIIAPTCAKVG